MKLSKRINPKYGKAEELFKEDISVQEHPFLDELRKYVIEYKKHVP